MVMKRTIAGSIKQVLTKGKDSFLKLCKECGHYFPKDAFCPHCQIKLEQEHR